MICVGVRWECDGGGGEFYFGGGAGGGMTDVHPTPFPFTTPAPGRKVVVVEAHNTEDALKYSNQQAVGCYRVKEAEEEDLYFY